MTTVNQLPLATALVSGDQLLLWKTLNGDSRRVSFGTIRSSVLASPAVTGTMTYQGAEVDFGANDSGGAGYRILRVPNA